MRIPVFARGANPRVDRWILKKSLAYCLDQVNQCMANWVDPNDHSKGIICSAMLNFGKRIFQPQPEPVSFLGVGELPGLRFVGPKNPLPHFISSIGPDQGWDWSMEKASA